MSYAFDEKKIQKLLKKKLSEERFIHSKNVAVRAREIAKNNGADVEKAYFTGLVHDICKDMHIAEMLHYIEIYGIRLDEVSKNSPQVLHAPAGAAYLALELKIEDEEILNAVRYHTTGRRDMSLFEKIIYLADLTSSDRGYKDFLYTKSLVDKDIDAAMLYALAFTIGDMAKKKKPVCPDTVEGYNQYLVKALESAQT